MPVTVFHSEPTTPRTAPDPQAISRVIAAAGEKYGAVGVQVAIIQKGEVSQCFAWGWATKDTTPMTPWHKIRVASLSKIVLGITAQLLREEGKVELTGQIGTYWNIKTQKPVTPEEILTHTSALRNYDTALSREYAQVKKRLENGGFSGATPGDMATWTYNNYAFGVLGMTLELAAEETVDDILHRRLFQEMDIDAAFSGGFLERKDLIATLYRSTGAVARTAQMQETMTREETPGATGTYFAGGFLCSAYDFAKLLSLLAGDGSYKGTQLLTEGSVALMEAYRDTPTPNGSYQAHPMRCRENLYGREKIYYHTGSAYGVYSCASYDPATGDGVVVLTTGARGSKDKYGIYNICTELNGYIYELLE